MKLPTSSTVANKPSPAIAAANARMQRIFRAPGRVNLIGEHTDYNDGYVLPVAIDLECTAKIKPAAGGRLTVRSVEMGEEHFWEVGELASARPRQDWSDYVGGVAVELLRLGVSIPPSLIEIQSTVPMGAGLSSSASLEIAVALALSTVAGSSLSRRELAVAALAAEQNFVGTRCGIMDQLISVFGRKEHALLIDCRSLEYRAVRIPAGLELVMVNTRVPHQLSSSQYNQRRDECDEAARLLKRPLRDVGAADWPRAEKLLPDPLMRRARHIVSENIRVLEFVQALEYNEVGQLKALMSASHRSLANDYEVSCAELDFLVEQANQMQAVAGARMTGGGFGGCTVNLVHAGAVDAFRREIEEVYMRRFKMRPVVYLSRPADGAREITTN